MFCIYRSFIHRSLSENILHESSSLMSNSNSKGLSKSALSDRCQEGSKVFGESTTDVSACETDLSFSRFVYFDFLYKRNWSCAVQCLAFSMRKKHVFWSCMKCNTNGLRFVAWVADTNIKRVRMIRRWKPWQDARNSNGAYPWGTSKQDTEMELYNCY